MVAASDLRIFKTTNNLGGAITSTQFLSDTPNNLFSNVPRNEQVLGEDYYACVYLKNTHPSEAMENFKLWLSNDQLPDTTVKWGFDNSATSGYRFSPNKNFNGTTDYGIADPTGKDCDNFTVSCWFKTSTVFTTDAILMCKGKHSSEATTDNHNYVLYMNTSGQIVGGYETSAGTNSYATTPSSYNDGNWHHVILSYNGSNVNIWIDGASVANPSGVGTPNTNGWSFIIGRSSGESLYWFTGQIDEINLWNRALTSTEKTDLYTNNTSPLSGRLLRQTYGPDDNIFTAQTIADKYTAPTDITWNELGFEPLEPNRGRLGPQIYFPIWIWLHVNANAEARLDDNCKFSFKFNIPQGGTGSPGGGGGDPDPNPNNIILDQFGINKFFPTITAGREWFSTEWSNGENRTVEDEFDPDDSNFGSTEQATVLRGDGMASYIGAPTSTSTRLFVKGPWTNTETTLQMKIDGDATGLKIRGRSNHHGVDDLPYGMESSSPQISCGFGGYNSNFILDADEVSHEVEVIHDCYQRHLDEHASIQQNAGDGWWGYKQIIRSIGTQGVLVESYINRDITDQSAWVKESEFLFDGTNVSPDETEPNVTTCLALGDSISGDLVAGSKWLNPSYWTWLRIFNVDNVFIRNFSVREIAPINPSGGSSGGGGTPLPTPTDYKIAIVGDEGCEPETNDVIDMMIDEGYDYVVSVGDHAYESCSSSGCCWTSRFAPLRTKMNSAYGNHEYSENGGTGPYKSFFGHSKTYFTFQFENVFFFILDTNISISPGSAQHTFISNELARVKNDPTVTWRVGITHHPWYGASSDHGRNEFDQVQILHDLFVNNKVNFVATGHNHNWQRTHQIARNPGSTSSPTVVGTSSPYEASTPGLIHIVSGTGGHDSGSSLYSLGSQPSYQAYQNRTHNGVWEMVASNGGKTLTCSFVDTSGHKYDTFVINE